MKEGHDRDEIQYWDEIMLEQLATNQADYSQPWQLRRRMHMGVLKIRQQPGEALPGKRHLEYSLAVRLVQERERRTNEE